MGAWVGPAIVAAIISGLISLFVVQLNFRQERQAEQRRKAERIRDYQIALRAEIRSELRNLSRFDLDEVLVEVERRYQVEKDYSVTVPRIAPNIVFTALVQEIYVLPEAVIDPVVLYARQRLVVESLAEDIRAPSFRALSTDRQLAIYRDYLRTWQAWRDFAQEAEAALNSQGAPSSSAADRSGP